MNNFFLLYIAFTMGYKNERIAVNLYMRTIFMFTFLFFVKEVSAAYCLYHVKAEETGGAYAAGSVAMKDVIKDCFSIRGEMQLMSILNH